MIDFCVRDSKYNLKTVITSFFLKTSQKFKHFFISLELHSYKFKFYRVCTIKTKTLNAFLNEFLDKCNSFRAHCFNIRLKQTESKFLSLQ